tara:strand:+ start:24502 stop:27933 length:3432 start_codon:yes stop_codon:yes gene_type:complete
MAKEFKTPEKFIFNNGTVSYGYDNIPDFIGPPTLVGSDLPDEVRTYLGLTVRTHAQLGDADSVVYYSPSEAKPNYTAYLSLKLDDDGQFFIQRNSSLLPKQVDVSSDEYKAQEQRESSIIGDMESLNASIEQADQQQLVYQDFNFQLPKENRPNIGVETFLRGLNEFDIRSNNPDSPGGELDPTKEETSLKFAYAFQTIGIQGSSEVVKKQVKVANNFQELFKNADNTKKLPTKIERLKNIVYGGLTTKDLKAQSDAVLEGSATVQANDNKNNISIDKLYNVITLDVPAKPKVKTDFFSYLVENQEQLGFGKGLTDAALKFYESRINRFNAQGKISYDLAPPAGSLPFVSAGTMSNQVETQSDSSESTTKIPLDYLGLVKDNREQPDLKQNSKFLSETKENIKKTQGPNQAMTTRLEPYAQGESSFTRQIAGWLQGASKKGFQEYPPTNPNYFSTTVGQLNKYSISNLMRSAAKFNKPDKQTKLLLPASSRLNGMFADPQLIGFKVIKSSQPYNTTTANMQQFGATDPFSIFSNSIIQTFYINASQYEDVSEVRLYDSQIIYGEKYYYTLFGIYSVDGKYYYYENKGLTIEDEKNQLLKEAVYQTMIKEKPNLTGTGKYKNPCCRYKNLTSLSGNGDADKGVGPFKKANQTPDPAGWWITAVKANKLALGLSDYDTETLVQLVDAQNKFSSGWDSQKLINALTRLTSQSQPLKCFLCRRTNEYWMKSKYYSFLSFLQQVDPSNKAMGPWHRIQIALNCKDFTVAKLTAFAPPNLEGDVFDKAPGINQPCMVRYKEKGKMITPAEGVGIPKTFKEFRFAIKEMNARHTYEFPLQPSVDSTIINFVPLPPDATFVPLKGATDKVMIKFETLQETSTNYYKDGSLVHYAGFYYQPTDGVVDTLNGVLYQDLLTKSLDHALNNKIDIAEPVAGKIDLAIGVGATLARAEQDVKEVHAFKLDRTPTSREDLVLSGDRYVLNLLKGETAYFSNLKPNQKYYYVFASRDITGLYSGGTEVYQVEIVEDSGYSYTKIGIYDFVTKETKETTKSFKKLLKIKPSFEETLPSDAAGIGSTNLFSTIKYADGGGFGSGAQPSKFKIRIRSKKTKRAFDINIKYTQEIKKILTKKFLKQIKTHSTLIDTKDEGTN